MRFEKIINEWFYMPKSERNGIIVLLIILSVIIIARFSVAQISINKVESLDQPNNKVTQLKTALEYGDSIDVRNDSVYNFQDDDGGLYFDFNPNTVSYNQLLELGFTQRTASVLIKFRNSGFVFQLPDDLLKVYGVDSVLYKKLVAYIKLDNTSQKKKLTQNKLSKIEINTADTTELKKLPGIGSVLAKRICSYRNYLGGFVKIEQIKEVYNLPIETYNKIEPYLIVDRSEIEPLDINFITFKELIKHPYCNYDDTKKIINYRTNNGSYKNINQLIAAEVIDSSVYYKLSPYLVVGE